MFQSGEWEGYWLQKMGRKMHKGPMCPLAFVFTPDGIVQGRGEDEVGKFTFKGKFNEMGEVEMRKKYLGAHAVTYKGRADGTGGISGTWTISGFMSGEFAIKPVVSESVAVVEETAVAEKPRKRRAKPAPAEPLPSAAVTPAEPERPSPLRRRRSPPPANS